MKETITRTETRTFYVDLWPGWQDGGYMPSLSPMPPNNDLGARDRRFKIEIPLPVFGGSAEAEEFKSVAADGSGIRLDEVAR